MLKFASVKWWRFSPGQVLEKLDAATFDRRHGTDTSSFAELNTLDIDSANKVAGQRYQPSPVYSLRRVLRSLDIDYTRYAFVDVGSGKGRTLLVASELPFRRVVGVEFGAELHAQAERNIARYGRRAAQEMISVHADATLFVLPPDDLVLYFFNPFNRAVLDQVLANVNASLQAHPRKVILIYLYLPDQDWLAVLAGFQVKKRWRHYLVLENTPP
jgi:SAM-dependent methyltransferase